jgi:tetratricopeptide (TPR) repeat protein
MRMAPLFPAIAAAVLLAVVPAACQQPAASGLSAARALRDHGRYAEAESAYAAVERGGGPDLLAALVERGMLLEEQGRADAARELYQRVIDRSRETGQLESKQLAAVAAAHRQLGADDPAQVRAALRVFDEAIAADSANLDARVALGDLFFAKYNRPEAAEMYRGVLAVDSSYPGALYGLAIVGLEDGLPGSHAMLERVTKVAPNFVPARVALAQSHLDREAWAEADDEAGRALVVNPRSQPALAVQAAARLLRGDTAGFDAARARVRELNPRPAEFYADLSQAHGRNRLYREAAGWAAEGVRLDSSSARALGELGLNQLRLGQIAGARGNLERAFVRDPFNVWIKNTLDLMDVLERYDTTSVGRFQFVTDPSEHDLLVLYLAEIAPEAWDRFAMRYGYRPEERIRVELFRRHADFSVRTVGLAGFGALGVSFGPVVAMDAPSARSRGELNWGSTFWHELAHTFTLGATANRVPRWLSEGLSVHEEHQARPGWGMGLRLGFLRAWQAGQLLPVAELNDGFFRPKEPGQLLHSYYQASLVCELIESRWGLAGLNGLLSGYRAGMDTPAAFQRALGLSPEAFDREFDGWLKERLGPRLDAIGTEGKGPFFKAMAEGAEAVRRGRNQEAITAFERARSLFPEYAEAGSPWQALGELYQRQGNLAQAAEALGMQARLAETDYDANIAEADLRERLGDRRAAADALARAAWIDPREIGLHQRLATLAGALKDWAVAIRERRVVLALDPPNVAEARYQLALALYQSGDAAAARREVLRALELAPAFLQAQDLLLRIREGAPPR